MNIVHCKEETDYSEILQQQSVKMSFCKKEGDTLIELHKPVNCRDFFSDVLFSEQEDIKVSKYGFTWDPSKKKIDRDKVRMLLYPKYKQYSDSILKNLHILHKIEKDNKLKLTTVTLIEDNVLLVEGDKFWLNTIFSLNLYTYLLKCVSYSYKDVNNWMEELSEQLTNEGKYMRAMEYFYAILPHIRKIFSRPITVHGYSFKDDVLFTQIDLIHNFGGIMTLVRESHNKYALDEIRKNTYVKRFLKVC